MTTIDNSQCGVIASAFTTCTGFYQHEIKLCPERQQTLGAAFGYIALAKSICAAIYQVFVNIRRKMTESVSQIEANTPQAKRGKEVQV